MEKLRNEITRTPTLKAVAAIATSPLHVDLSPVLASAVSELSLFLRQQSRPLKLATLETLIALVKSNAANMTPDLFEVRPQTGPLDSGTSFISVLISSIYDSFSRMSSQKPPILSQMLISIYHIWLFSLLCQSSSKYAFAFIDPRRRWCKRRKAESDHDLLLFVYTGSHLRVPRS